ncbi:Acyl-coenzyme A thioesterase 11 [Fukomys damarensis]|uniref:Acyl-coenzyme A thioesterase 11 n=1 Tax=Fukomys damarensis TaxID=885580 RepID=A0A091D6Q0_FUKDA|nr:Acyl-coenzyme A thioesterase 11 [Fukomys damarensis]
MMKEGDVHVLLPMNAEAPGHSVEVFEDDSSEEQLLLLPILRDVKPVRMELLSPRCRLLCDVIVALPDNPGPVIRGRLFAFTLPRLDNLMKSVHFLFKLILPFPITSPWDWWGLCSKSTKQLCSEPLTIQLRVCNRAPTQGEAEADHPAHRGGEEEHSVAAERLRMRLLYADTMEDLLANCLLEPLLLLLPSHQTSAYVCPPAHLQSLRPTPAPQFLYFSLQLFPLLFVSHIVYFPYVNIRWMGNKFVSLSLATKHLST